MKPHKQSEELQSFTVPDAARLPQDPATPSPENTPIGSHTPEASGVKVWKWAAILISLLGIFLGDVVFTRLFQIPPYLYLASIISLVAFSCAWWGLKKRNAQGLANPSFTAAYVCSTIALFWPVISVFLHFLSAFFVYGILMNLPGVTTSP